MEKIMWTDKLLENLRNFLVKKNSNWRSKLAIQIARIRVINVGHLAPEGPKEIL